ncbi:hypothetical protein ACFX5U_08075 [Sphingobacterium sp. SG20118]|uniref:hypothetical protein n=1 Tax=Sphingobacterium sp. SG20118 TaxID=3367156 RepID=UPI0037DFBE12
MKKILIFSILIGILSSCSSMKDTTDITSVSLIGIITPLGMTTFQYGTHMIKAENKTYVLKSSNVQLNDYVNRSVSLIGKKVPGYPLEGGPELIEVSQISLK